jgi:UDP-N-acetylglucosamine 1-carboxyvinyltransferase
MGNLIIKGGYPLHGTVAVSGSKNAALPILVASLLTTGETFLENIPHLTDVTTMIRMLRSVGVKAEMTRNHVHISVLSQQQLKHIVPYELITKMRASFLIIGPLLARTGFAKVPLPGGCAIGLRPVDIHLKGLEALGARIKIEHGFVEVRADTLVGNKIYLDFPSVGATETLIMAAALTPGWTIIENAAQEPEVVALVNFLNKCGAKIQGGGTETIKIKGVGTLRGVTYRIISDRIEAGTLIAAGAITRGEIELENFEPEHLEAVLSKYQEMGVYFKGKGRRMMVSLEGKPRAVSIKTHPYPGFPTDMQPQTMAVLTLAEGTSVITENIFENRFIHVNELKRLGAEISIEGHSAIIKGKDFLTGCPVRISDLRAGAALMLAGFAAKGQTVLYGTEHIERGYEKIVEKFQKLGAKIEKT